MYLKEGIKQIISQFFHNSKKPDIHKSMFSFQSYKHFGKGCGQLFFSDTAQECGSISNKTLPKKLFKGVKEKDATARMFSIAGFIRITYLYVKVIHLGYKNHAILLSFMAKKIM